MYANHVVPNMPVSFIQHTCLIHKSISLFVFLSRTIFLMIFACSVLTSFNDAPFSADCCRREFYIVRLRVIQYPVGAILYIFLLSSGAALRATVLSSCPTIFPSPLLCVGRMGKLQGAGMLLAISR